MEKQKVWNSSPAKIDVSKVWGTNVWIWLTSPFQTLTRQFHACDYLSLVGILTSSHRVLIMWVKVSGVLIVNTWLFWITVNSLLVCGAGYAPNTQNLFFHVFFLRWWMLKIGWTNYKVSNDNGVGVRAVPNVAHPPCPLASLVTLVDVISIAHTHKHWNR